MSVDAAKAILTERLSGPPCPVCWRDDGGHSVGCQVPEYLAAWRRIHGDQADRIADAIWPSAAAS